MKTRLLVVLSALLLLSSFTVPIAGLTGCASVDAKADAVVVNAERTAQAAFEIMDAFVLYEYNNREALAKMSPDIHKAADAIRVDGKHAIQELRAATKAYKENRTPQRKATIDTWMALVEQFKRTALKYLTAEQKKP